MHPLISHKSKYSSLWRRRVKQDVVREDEGEDGERARWLNWNKDDEKMWNDS